MAGPIASLFVKLGLDAREFTQGIDKASAAAAGFAKGGGLNAAGVALGTFAGNVATAFGREALGTITDFVGGSIEAFKQQEEALSTLDTSLRANAPGWEKYTGAIRDAETAAINLGFQDDDLDLSLARVVAATHDVKKGLDVMSVAEDLARFKHISLQDAADALIKVEAGQYRMLKSLGIQLPKNATAEQALAAVQAVAHGQALAYTDTYSGKLDVMNAKMNEQQEIIGKRLVPLQLQLNGLLVTAATAVGDFADNYDRLKQDLVETPKVNFLDTMPTQADVQAAIDRLKALPDSFKAGGANANPIQAALFDLNINGVKDTWAKQIRDLEAYLAGQWGAQAQELQRMDLWGKPMTASMKQAFDEAAAEAAKDGPGLGTALAQGIKIGRGSSVWATLMLKAHDLGAGIPDAITKGLQDDQSALESGLSQLQDVLKNGLTPDQLVAEATGRDVVRAIRRGMNSQQIGAKQDAEHLMGVAIKAMVDGAKNGVMGGKSAKQTGEYLALLADEGINDKASLETYFKAQGFTDAEIAALEAQFPAFFRMGVQLANQVNAGFNGQVTSAGHNRWHPKGWTPGGTSGGGTSGGSSGGTRVRALGGSVMAGEAYIVGERRPELFVPETNGRILPRVPSGGGLTVIVNIQNQYGGPAGLDALARDLYSRLRQVTRGAGWQVGR